MNYKDEDVVYIEYQDGKEFAVITGSGDKLWMSHYDFEIDCNDDSGMMHHNSGRGGSAVEGIETNGQETVWIDPRVRLLGNLENVTVLKEPLRDPFKEARKVFQTIHCKFCEKWLDEDWCEHLVENNGNVEYYDGSVHD